MDQDDVRADWDALSSWDRRCHFCQEAEYEITGALPGRLQVECPECEHSTGYRGRQEDNRWRGRS